MIPFVPNPPGMRIMYASYAYAASASRSCFIYLIPLNVYQDAPRIIGS